MATTTAAVPTTPSRTPVRRVGPAPLRSSAASPASANTSSDAELAALQLRRVELKAQIRDVGTRVRRMQLIEKCLDEDEMNKLMDLCGKWQSAAQRAVEELHKKGNGTANVGQILEAFSIKPELLNYNKVTDGFGGTTW